MSGRCFSYFSCWPVRCLWFLCTEAVMARTTATSMTLPPPARPRASRRSGSCDGNAKRSRPRSRSSRKTPWKRGRGRRPPPERPSRRGRRREIQREAASTVRTRVKGGYRPATVHGRVGERLRLICRREESAACSEHVVVSAFGKSAMLPVHEDVALELLPERAGGSSSAARSGLLRGRLMVTGPGDPTSATNVLDAEHSGATRRRGRARRSEAIHTALLLERCRADPTGIPP